MIFWEIRKIWGYPDINRIPSNSGFSFVRKYKRIACFSFVRKNRQTNKQTNRQNSVAKTWLSARGVSRQIIDNDDRSQEYIFLRNINSWQCQEYVFLHQECSRILIPLEARKIYSGGIYLPKRGKMVRNKIPGI